MATKRTIVLKHMDHCVYEEAKIGEVGCKPGHLIKINSAGQIIKHNVRGGKAERAFLREDSLQGLTYLDAYTNGADGGQYFLAKPGVQIQALLKAGENVAVDDLVMSNGDGTLCKAIAAVLQENLADSTTITNVNTETTFSNGSIVLPANFLKAGMVLRVRGSVAFPATNSTDTATVKLKIGSTVIATIPATDVANGDVAVFDATITVRTAGAAGTFVATGQYSIGAGGTATVRNFTLDSTTIDTTAAQTLAVTLTWSVANAGNQGILRTLLVEEMAGATATGGGQGLGNDIVGKVLTAKDLSVSGTDDFVEIRIL